MAKGIDLALALASIAFEAHAKQMPRRDLPIRALLRGDACPVMVLGDVSFAVEAWRGHDVCGCVDVFVYSECERLGRRDLAEAYSRMG